MKAKGLYEDLEREMTAVQMQAKAIEDELSVWPADLMDKAGCVVHVGQNGAVAVKYGLIRPEDRNDMAQAGVISVSVQKVPVRDWGNPQASWSQQA